MSTFDAHEPWFREDDVTVLVINNLGAQIEISTVVEEVLDVLNCSVSCLLRSVYDLVECAWILNFRRE